MPRPRMLHLGAILNSGGHHIAGWRLPEAQTGSSLDRYIRLARIAESGKLDFIFFADHLAVWERGTLETLSHSARMIAEIEPLTLLSALAGHTSSIGLVATASTTYSHPYNLARQFASIDHISGGRAGWNVVTSYMAEEARNFGVGEVESHGGRYGRAGEFVGVMKGLWDSWEDDAFLFDKAGGRFFRPEVLHYLDHVGAHYSVRGPLNVGRSPQAYPVIFQAGSSEDGKAFSAGHADVVFTAADTIDKARGFRAEMRQRAMAAGRSADDIKIVPGIFPVIAETEELARRKLAEMGDLVHPAVAFEMLQSLLGVSLSGHDLDDPVPELPVTQANQSMQNALVATARRQGLTIRQLAHQAAVARGAPIVVGTPRQVADFMHEWLIEDAADGFNLLCPYFPGGLSDVVEQVIPILQSRGVFRSDYEGSTLREHFGLSRPANQFVADSGAEERIARRAN